MEKYYGKDNMTALDIYISRAYKITLLSITLACLSAGISYTGNRLQAKFDIKNFLPRSDDDFYLFECLYGITVSDYCKKRGDRKE